jgi:hypothetical protein
MNLFAIFLMLAYSQARFTVRNEKLSVRMDFPDELMKEFVQRVTTRYLIAKQQATESA